MIPRSRRFRRRSSENRKSWIGESAVSCHVARVELKHKGHEDPPRVHEASHLMTRTPSDLEGTQGLAMGQKPTFVDLRVLLVSTSSADVVETADAVAVGVLNT